MKPVLVIFLSFLSVSCTNGDEIERNDLKTEDMERNPIEHIVEISVGSSVFEAVFEDNTTSKSLLEQMPFTVDLEDHAGNEKIFYPKESLSTECAPSGADPAVGDIMYYAPWGDVAIFYKDFKYANGLIPMGKLEDVDGFVNALSRSKEVTIQKK